MTSRSQPGKFDVLKRSIAALADDRRIQVLLIAFSFGAFIEGAAGFGTPVAISAAMLIGLGFKPLPAAGLALIGNTAPVAFGALGTPLIALARVTELPSRVPEYDGWETTATVFDYRPLLVDLGDGWLAQHDRSVASLPRSWPQLCNHAISRQQLPWPVVGRRH